MASGRTNINVSRADADLATAIWLTHLDVYKNRGQVIRDALLRLAEDICWPDEPTPEAIHTANTIRKVLGYPMLGADGKGATGCLS